MAQTIQSWAEEDRPREKLLLKGKMALSDAELLAILIGSGTVDANALDLAKLVLQKAENNLHELGKLSLNDMMQLKGIGQARGITILAALELGRRRKAAEPPKRYKITSSLDAYEAISPYLLDKKHEEFWVLLLNRSNIILKIKQISSGGIASTVADQSLIFKAAIEESASSIILIHNHPSENLQASQADIEFTKKIVSSGKLLDIPILDHLIFTDKAYFSFADEGMM